MRQQTTTLLLSFLICLLYGLGRSPSMVLAGPPAPLTFVISQPEKIGTFEARAWGDERLSGLETTDGFTVLQDSANGYWYYAEINPTSGQLMATDRLVGIDQPPATARGARPPLISDQSRPASQAAVNVPAVPVLVLMVQYANQPAVTTEADWIGTFFGSTSSIQDYYQQISYNQFLLTPAQETCGTPDDGLTGWLTLGTTHPNAGGPSIALAALKAGDVCVDYTIFDKNGDDQITANELLPLIIVAGYEASYGGALALTPNIWGHQSAVDYHSVADEVTVRLYAQFGEWHANTWDYPGHQATIGPIVHEIGHLIGWPDLYDNLPPGNPDSQGVGEWSVMGHGLWLGAGHLGDTPGHPSAWEKWYQGWLTPLQVQDTRLNQPLPRVEDNGENSVIQLLDNPYGVDWSFGDFSGNGEYFLVENRQKTGYDASLPGCGLLIWHIDETVVSSNWANSDEDHKLVDLEEADGLDHLDQMINRGDTGDSYPGTTGNTGFNDFSLPHSRLYNESTSGLAISNISPGCADIKTATFFAPPTVQMTKTASPQPVTVGQLLAYTLTIANNGSTTVTGLVLTDTVPVHTTLDAGSLSSDASHSGLPPGSLITWTPGFDLAPGQAMTRTFSVTVDLGLPDGTPIANTAYFSSNARFDNSFVATTVVAPKLKATITPDPDPIEASTQLITYTLTLHNEGHSEATNVIIANTIPANTSYLSGTASDGGSEDPSGSGVIAWPPTILAPNSTVTRSFQVAVLTPLSDGDSLVNTVSVNTAEGINLNEVEQVEIVGLRSLYLPLIQKN